MELVRPPRSQASGRLKSAANAIDSEARLTVKAVKTSLSLSLSLSLSVSYVPHWVHTNTLTLSHRLSFLGQLASESSISWLLHVEVVQFFWPSPPIVVIVAFN